jgi:hypothetical protein
LIVIILEKSPDLIAIRVNLVVLVASDDDGDKLGSALAGRRSSSHVRVEVLKVAGHNALLQTQEIGYRHNYQSFNRLVIQQIIFSSIMPNF